MTSIYGTLTGMMIQPRLMVLCIGVMLSGSVLAEDRVAPESPESEESVQERRKDEAALNEDPEAQRQAVAETADPEVRDRREESTSLEVYASARVHAINTFDVETGNRDSKVGDGNSRIGLRADWQYAPGWWLLGRGEIGLDLVDSYTTRGDQAGDGGVTMRLAYAGIERNNLKLLVGQNWSAYYQVAGITDRFAIFGGSASGAYNAGTAGQNTGTGRAEDVIQLRANIQPDRWAPWLKPFNLNLQYQVGQPIPSLENGKYDYAYGASAFLELQNEFGLGLAYNRAKVPENLVTTGASGITGDAEAIAISTRGFGKRWYASLLLTRLKNMEVTDTGRYFDADGVELYAQWELVDRWWLIGGFNALEPNSNDPLVGDYRVRYAVVGARFTFRSFERMVYAEYRIDEGRTVDGSARKDEVTIGVRWDFDL